VGIQQDAYRLGRDYGISVRGAVEVRGLSSAAPSGLVGRARRCGQR
jgi:hypothetical protein